MTALAAAAPLATGSDDPLGVRKDFPALQDYTFLNTAYIGLIPRPVVEAAHDWIEARARHAYSVGQMEAKKHEVRKLFAEMVGASEDEIGFLFQPRRVRISLSIRWTSSLVTTSCSTIWFTNQPQ